MSFILMLIMYIYICMYYIKHKYIDNTKLKFIIFIHHFHSLLDFYGAFYGFLQ